MGRSQRHGHGVTACVSRPAGGCASACDKSLGAIGTGEDGVEAGFDGENGECEGGKRDRILVHDDCTFCFCMFLFKKHFLNGSRALSYLCAPACVVIMSDISEKVSILLWASFNIKKTHIYKKVGRMVFKRRCGSTVSSYKSPCWSCVYLGSNLLKFHLNRLLWPVRKWRWRYRAWKHSC